jgi:hypothetical protein
MTVQRAVNRSELDPCTRSSEVGNALSERSQNAESAGTPSYRFW